MSKASTLTDRDAQYKAQAERFLAEAQSILREMATERRRAERGRGARPSITAEIKAILRGA
jgi:hypothetical protein